MARTYKRLQRIDIRIYIAVKVDSNKCELCPQQFLFYVPVRLISDVSCSSNDELEETIWEEMRKVDTALKTMLEKSLWGHPGPCTNNRCDGLKMHGQREVGRIYHISNRKSDPNLKTRLLYNQIRLLKKQLFRKKNAEWYRKGLQNNQKKCHYIQSAA